MSVPEVAESVARDTVFFDESGGGLTISGGEPLMQPDFVKGLLEACRNSRIRTVLDTCGYADPSVLPDICDKVDLFLYDLKIMDEAKHRRFTGVGNDLILTNLKFLARHHSHVLIRIPVIPGVNDDLQNIDAVAEFLTPLGLRDIELLPYHRLAHSKRERMHKQCGMEKVQPPTQEQVEAIAARLRRSGFDVRIGG